MKTENRRQKTDNGLVIARQHSKAMPKQSHVILRRSRRISELRFFATLRMTAILDCFVVPFRQRTDSSEFWRTGLLAMTAVFLFNIPSALACPFCKDAFAKMGQIWTVIGFNLSIYVMIATPFLLVASFIIVLYLNYKKQRPH